MELPLPGDYIDIHTHGSHTMSGIYTIENLMANEARTPGDIPGRPCTFGIHPWYLNKDTIDGLLDNVRSCAVSSNVVAIGEAGFDKLRGPSLELQRNAFEEQVKISEEIRKPVFIHCVRAWDELLPVYKRLRPKMPWMVHGFRGNVQLAMQLITKGMYLSFWFDFIVRPEASKLMMSLPKDRIFLETDGSDIGISTIYKKVAADLDLSEDELKSVILANFIKFFHPDATLTYFKNIKKST